MNPRQARRPGAIYAIADAGLLGSERLPAAAAAMAAGGVSTIQIRAKQLPDRELYRLSERVRAALDGWPGELWIDDRVDLALMLPFAGVHLGQLDLPCSAARSVLPAATALGTSTHDQEQVMRADADAAVDWVAIGPIYPTASKSGPDPVIGLAGLRAGRRRTSKPLIAIGGIDSERLEQLFEAGADAVAVLSAVSTGEIESRCRELVRRAERLI